MIRKINYILVALVLLPVAAVFAGAQDSKTGWQLDLKRAALNLTTTQVKNADVYANFPDSRLSADTQTLMQGFLNFETSYNAQKYLWTNGIIAEYGKTTIKPTHGAQTKTENADKIVLTSDIAYKIWQVENYLGGFYAGPFANISYETEFTRQSNVPRKKLMRSLLGAKAFEGKYIKSLHAAAVFEEDFTYSKETSANLAWEAGLNIEHAIREGVKVSYGLLFRDYIDNNEELPTNLDYEFEASARMDVLVYKNMAIAPFINYYIAQGKYTAGLGQNLYVGVSFSFSKILKTR
jgi:hypothetical protein